MQLNVSNGLLSPGEWFDFDMAVMIPDQKIYEEDIVFEAMRLTGRYSTTEDRRVYINGELAGKVKAHCANCLESLMLTLKAPFSETFEEMRMDKSRIDKKPDINDFIDGEPENYKYSGHVLDLSQMVLTAAILALPMRFLCSENCKGLCVNCGKNLNKENCECGNNNKTDNPFAALEKLFSQKEDL